MIALIDLSVTSYSGCEDNGTCRDEGTTWTKDCIKYECKKINNVFKADPIIKGTETRVLMLRIFILTQLFLIFMKVSLLSCSLSNNIVIEYFPFFSSTQYLFNKMQSHTMK